jgi:exodeoxyribonuclease V gamma subunit
MLNVYQSNRLEQLMERLAEVVSQPKRSVFEPDTIVVQSQGMAHWLSLRLAERLGICTNVRFPFPAAFIWDVFRATLPDVSIESPYGPRVWAWHIMGRLSKLIEAPEFAPVQAYLQHGDELQSFELSRRIAETFDQYLVYRPDWIREWESGRGDHWQARLWRHLVESVQGSHWVALHDEFSAALDTQRVKTENLPSSVYLFGISALAPSLLEVLTRLAELIEVHMFLPNPCRQYWGDIIQREQVAKRAGDQALRELNLKSGNSLLASFGQQGRDFLDMLQGYPTLDHAIFEDIIEDSVLHCLQADILDLRERGGTGEHPQTTPAPEDRSIQVHNCHSPMREIEVLYEQLLSLFESYPDLAPSQVIVMAPDIEVYAPYIEAVFGATDAERSIPFSIADRGLRAASHSVETFFKLLDIVNGRFDVNQVLGLLETSAVQSTFKFSAADLRWLIIWIRDAGIRWGIDAQDRAVRGLPNIKENTWRAGLERMLLGYAMGGEDQTLFKGIAPYDEVEGVDAQALGRLQTFIDALIAVRNELGHPRAAGQWGRILLSMLESFFGAVETEDQGMRAVRIALDELAVTAEQAGYRESISLEVVKAFLAKSLSFPHLGRTLLSGSVTFCQLVPRRSLPSDVVCLIGMSDGSFPRRQHRYGFDRMACDFRCGDRSRRNEDHYLFLQSLLSARRCFYISYIGQDIRDNSLIPPSVVVSELLDYVAQGFDSRAAGYGLNPVITRHPLQAFSKRYFSGKAGLFSYSQALGEASRVLGARQKESVPFVPAALPQPNEEWQGVELEQLVRFIKHPTCYLLKERLGIILEEQKEILETREPFKLEGLERYALRHCLLTQRLKGEDYDDMFARLRARGQIPHGQVGASVMQGEFDELDRFVERVKRVYSADTFDPLEINLVFGDRRLTGWLGDVVPGGLIRFRMSKIKAKDRLSLWIQHLVLNHIAPSGVEHSSHWLGDDDQEFNLGPVEEPECYLEQLLDLYWKGLSHPLHFFPESAFVLAHDLMQSKPDPISRARRTWEGGDYGVGESQDAYYELAFRAVDPLDDEFVSLALAVYEPLLAHETR